MRFVLPAGNAQVIVDGRILGPEDPEFGEPGDLLLSPLTGADGFTYNAQDSGILPGGSGTSNRTTLNALIVTAHAAGGGTIYFPRGDYRFASDVSNNTITMTSVSNIRFLGEGSGSRLLWDGEFAGAGHFFKVSRGCRDITWESLYIAAGTGAKTDSAEQHHAIALMSDVGAPIIKNGEYFRIVNCRFGYVRGDGVNVAGGVGQAHVKASIAGTVAAGALSGPFGQPLTGEAQRVTVQYPGGWDGGSFTVTGTDVNGVALVETIPTGVSIVNTGFEEFATITAISKSATGTTSNVANIGFAYLTRNVWIERCQFNGFDVSGGAPQTNGYRSAVGCQRYSVNVHVKRNYMTGCGDQLIDFEATGAGGVGPWDIAENVIVNANPNAGAGPPKNAVSFFGNSETRDRNSRSKLRGNYLYGVVVGGKTERVDIVDNIIVPVPNEASAGGISMDGTAVDVLVARNRIVGNPTCLNVPIRFVVNNALGPDGLRILDNTVEHYGTTGIHVEGARDLTVAGNRIVNLSAAVATNKGIIVAADDVNSIPMVGADVHHNRVIGDRGGGTLQYGIEFQPGVQVNADVRCTDNEVRGAATRGLSFIDGTYGTPPVVTGNRLTGTTRVELGTAVVVAEGGNPGTAVTLFGPVADPNTLSGLDGAVLGSLYRSHGNANVYRKKTAGASGWVTLATA